MTLDLCLIDPALDAAGVASFLRGQQSHRVAVMGGSVELGPFRSAFEELRGGLGALAPRTDAQLAPILHEAMRSVERRNLLDHRLWQWLCLEPLREYVLARWCDGAAVDAVDGFKMSQLNRFVGGPTLNGVGRNALARLFWGAETAFVDTGKYDDCRAVFASADLFVGVFERKIGLRPQAAMAIIRRLIGEPEAYRREALKRMNFVLSTTALEALSGQELVAEIDRLME